MNSISPEQQSEITVLSKQGYRLIKEGLTNRAIDIFENIINLQPDNSYALVGLGDALRKEKRFNEAMKYYQECLNYQKDNRYAIFGLADCYKSLKQYNRAVETWKSYLEYDDKNITVLTRLADAYRKIHAFQKSEDIYLKVLEMDDKNSYALIGLGHLNYDFKKYSEALKYWQKMEEIVGDRADIRVLTSIGNCYRKLREFSKGIPYFKKALEKQNRNFYALYGLADCYRGMSQAEKSLECWILILENDPENKLILTRCGDACRNMKDYERASDYYNKALSIEYDVYAELGLALIDKIRENYNEAINRLYSLVEKEPKNPRFYVEIAECYEKQGDKQRAVEVLGDFSKLGLSSPMVETYAENLQKPS